MQAGLDSVEHLFGGGTAGTQSALAALESSAHEPGVASTRARSMYSWPHSCQRTDSQDIVTSPLGQLGPHS